MSEREGQNRRTGRCPAGTRSTPTSRSPSGRGGESHPGTGRPSSGRAPSRPGPSAHGSSKVSDVTRAVRTAIRQDPRLLDVWVEGEIGRVTVSSAGHAYFALKDERNQLQCVWFRDDRERSLFAGAGRACASSSTAASTCTSRAARCSSTSTRSSRPGVGDLALRFEALKARLAAEGLFDAARKRPLPVASARRSPSSRARRARSGATSATSWRGAGRWSGSCSWPRRCRATARRRASSPPSAGSSASIARCMRTGRPDDAPALTILARGGGSLEDLWAFNDERVVRAVVAHPLPVVCGVGHEVDVTLADFAADVRAPTPSAAAEIVVPDRLEMAASLAPRRRDRLTAATERRLAAAARDLAVERRALERSARPARLAAAREQVGLLFDRATRAVEARLARERLPPDGRLGRRCRGSPADASLRPARPWTPRRAALSVLGPNATLERGYAIVRRARTGRSSATRRRAGRHGASRSGSPAARSRDRRRPGS